jgi:hypothetical protein
MLKKALEWSFVSMEAALFSSTFEIKRYVKRDVKVLCKWVSLWVGAPLWNLEGIRLPGLSERKG